jgi:hypothetical protein
MMHQGILMKPQTGFLYGHQKRPVQHLSNPVFQLIKESGSESLALIVHYFGSKDLAKSIVMNSRDDENALVTYFPPSHALK